MAFLSSPLRLKTIIKLMEVLLPKDEAARRAVRQQYRALDTLPETVFDQLTQLAAQICGVPLAAVSLIDGERQWFKTRVGFTLEETPRHLSFCSYTTLQTGVMVVPDAQADARFVGNPLVIGAPHLRFYAGVPLVPAGGEALGALCVMDVAPRQLTTMQREALQTLGQHVVNQLELRRSQNELRATLAQKEAAEHRLRAIVAGTARIVGRDFFPSMVRHLAQALPVKMAFVTECVNPEKTRARTLAFWDGKGLADAVEYEVSETPCVGVYTGKTCFYASELPRLFPHDAVLLDWQAQSYLGVPLLDAAGDVIGHLAVIDDAPMEEARGLDILKIFAARAAAELERMKAEAELHASMREIERLRDQLQAENSYLREEILLENNFEEIIGNSPALLTVLQELKRAAPTDATVLILGETGTGKELLARALHRLSRRSARPLVKINCAAISAGLVESELFGHAQGAFTGALENRTGRFALADGGTLLLDEVGELPLETQSKLLRVLQEGEFDPVGSSHTIKVDVRIIAVSNRNLEAEVAAGRFRADLFYRLNVLPLHSPPLRERRSDIPALATFFAARFARRLDRRLTGIAPATLERLQEYRWPGNVRELQNVIERAVVMATDSLLTIEPHFLPVTPPIDLPLPPRPLPDDTSLDAHERAHILAVLTQVNWVIEGKSGAAQALNMHPSTLRSRLKKLGIARPT